MRRWLAVLVFALTACSQGGSGPVASFSATPSQAAIPSAAPGMSPVPSPNPDLPLTAVGFSCRLPAYVQTGYEGSNDFSRRGEFINFPSGTIAKTSGGGGYFDRALNRWLPVTRESVSPDGTHYAQIDMENQVLRVVEVASGKDHAFSLSSINANAVFDYSNDGIYMTSGFEGLHGLTLVDPVTGSSHKVAGVDSPEASGGSGVFWVGEVNHADPHPIVTRASVGIGGTLPNQITRVDVKSGARMPWLYLPGNGVTVVGLDVHGHPLINVVQSWGTDISELFIAPSADSRQSIYKGPIAGTLSGAIADSHGVWFGSPQGIYFFTNSGSLLKVSNQPGYPANGCF